MRLSALNVVACLTVLGAGAPAWCHGPQMQLTAEAGKIVTRQVMIDDYTPVTAAASIYVLPVASVSNIWVVQPPGTAGSGPGIAPGVGFVDAASHPFKTGNYTTSIVDGLKKWNGASFVDAVSVMSDAAMGPVRAGVKRRDGKQRFIHCWLPVCARS